MSLIEKIDAMISECHRPGGCSVLHESINSEKAKVLREVKRLILSEQKEPCYNASDCLYKEDSNYLIGGPCPHQIKPTTIGDKIRENNESLANEIMKFGQRCYDCDYKEKPECNVKSCKDGILEYLNQPYTEVYDD